MSTIKLKRSSNTGLPSNGSLLQGEVAYSFSANTTDGGKKLYIGSGDSATDPAIAIGGEFYTSKLDHTPGVLTGNSALIVDAVGRIDQVLVGNTTQIVDLTNTGIDLPGTGFAVTGGTITLDNQKITGAATPTANSDVATKKYVDDASGGLTVSANGVSGTIGSLDTLVIAGENSVTTGFDPNTNILSIGVQQQLGSDANVAFNKVTAGSGDDKIEILSDSINQVDPKKYVEFDASAAGAVDLSNDRFNIPNHGFVNGDAVSYTPTPGETAISTLSGAPTVYYIVNSNTTHFELAQSFPGSTYSLGSTAPTGDSDIFETASNPISLFATSDSVTIGSSAKSIVDIQDDLTVGGDATITGNLQVLGTTTTVDSTVITIKDPVIELGESGADDNLDRGIKFKYNNSGAKHGFFGFRDSDQKFVLIPDANNAVDSQIFTGATGTLVADVEGDLTGNADTATGLANAFVLSLGGSVTGNVSIDGTGNVSITTSLANTVSELLGDYIEYVTIPGTYDANSVFTPDANGSAISISSLNGNNTDPARLAISVQTATTRDNSTDITAGELGVAAFSNTAFTVTNGFVDLNVVDGGTFGS